MERELLIAVQSDVLRFLGHRPSTRLEYYETIYEMVRSLELTTPHTLRVYGELFEQ
jgi:hypothetical protein